MPRQSRGPRLWLRAARARKGTLESAVWLIRDGDHSQSTGCGDGDREGAERQLAAYIAGKYAPQRRERDISRIPIADVINIYLAVPAPPQARLKWVVARLPIWTGIDMAAPLWTWDGNEDKPTLSPSIHTLGCWHGFVRAGEMVEA